MQNFIWSFILSGCLAGSLAAQTHGRETIVIETALGRMKIKLFEETPLHRDNFLKLVREGFFDSLMFHRVINQFMIQGGDPLSLKAGPGDSLGHGDLGYMVPAEIRPELIHEKGRLCAAREGDDINPQMASSASQFYIVMGKKRTPAELEEIADRKNKQRYNQCARQLMASEEGRALKQEYNRLKTENKTDSAGAVNARIEAKIRESYNSRPGYSFSALQRKVYAEKAGTPHLDGAYTVFGEVTEGMDVIDRIATVKTDKRDRPVQDIRMKVYIINQ